MIRVLVADDQALVRGSFRLLVETAPGMVAVGEAATGVEAVELATATGADVVLMDVRMPEMDGIEATRRICASPETAGTKVVILTTFDLDTYVYAALRAGASGFLLKDTPPAELLRAITVVAQGDALLAPSVTRRLIAEFSLQEPLVPASGLDRVTDREREVLDLVARGYDNAAIARRLVLSAKTVRNYLSGILTKLAVPDRGALIVRARDGGLGQD